MKKKHEPVVPKEKWSFLETSRSILEKDKQTSNATTAADKAHEEIKDSQADNLSEAEPDVNKILPTMRS